MLRCTLAARCSADAAVAPAHVPVCSLRERLTAEEQARVKAEAAAAKASAAAEAAADALAVKEQQLAGWRDLEQASKAAASQQMQLSQVCASKQRPPRNNSMCVRRTGT